MPSVTGNSRDLMNGMMAGIIAGLVASAAMNQFQALLTRLASGRERSHGAQSFQPGSPHHGIAGEMQKRGSDREEDDAAMRLGNAISVSAFDRDLTNEQKHRAGTLIHYIFGASVGAAYGAVAELQPAVTTGAGLPMGAVLWATGDEMAVPALGLSMWPDAYPLSIHASSLASHLVYGFTTEWVRRAIRRN